QVQVEVPGTKMNSVEALGTLPVKGPGVKGAASAVRGPEYGGNGQEQLLVRDVARIEAGSMPGEIDRYNSRRPVSPTANRSGPGGHAGPGGGAGRRRAARRGRGGRPRPGSAPGADVPGTGRRAGPRGGRHLPAADGLFSVAPAGLARHLGHAGGAGRGAARPG